MTLEKMKLIALSSLMLAMGTSSVTYAENSTIEEFDPPEELDSNGNYIANTINLDNSTNSKYDRLDIKINHHDNEVPEYSKVFLLPEGSKNPVYKITCIYGEPINGFTNNMLPKPKSYKVEILDKEECNKYDPIFLNTNTIIKATSEHDYNGIFIHRWLPILRKANPNNRSKYSYVIKNDGSAGYVPSVNIVNISQANIEDIVNIVNK